MLYWTLILMVIALSAAVFGFTNIARESARAAKVFFVLFFIMFFVSLAIQFLA